MRMGSLARVAIWPVLALTLLGMRPGASITVLRDEAVARYPETIEFHLSAASSAEIDWVELSFETDALTCGEAATRAYPEDFVASNEVEVEWTWNLRQAGSLPPGTAITWHWTLRDTVGAEVVTPEQSLTFTNTNIGWHQAASGALDLYWTEGDQVFADTLLAAGEAALQGLGEMTGVELSQRVQAYVFPSSEQMQANTLFAPDWSGGLAFPNHSTILLAVEPGSLSWGRQVMAHELAHVVIGAYTFSCFDRMPTWLDEGLALVAEGRDEPFAGFLLETAINEDSLLSVRSLALSFSADPDLALLAYSESESLVQFLLEAYGQDRMLQLLDEFRSGASEDRALDEVYGFDRDGLEAEWRSSIGAQPMDYRDEVAGAEPTRTPYPTFAPITGPLSAATTTPASIPSPSPGENDPRGATAPRSFLAVLALAGGCGLAVALALVIVVIARRTPSRPPSGRRS